MYRVRRLVLKARDFVLHLQLAALQIGDREIVGRRMSDGLGDFVFEGLMLPFQLRKMRLNRHVFCLLCQISA